MVIELRLARSYCGSDIIAAGSLQQICLTVTRPMLFLVLCTVKQICIQSSVVDAISNATAAIMHAVGVEILNFVEV